MVVARITNAIGTIKDDGIIPLSLNKSALNTGIVGYANIISINEVKAKIIAILLLIIILNL